MELYTNEFDTIETERDNCKRCDQLRILNPNGYGSRSCELGDPSEFLTWHGEKWLQRGVTRGK